MMRVLGYKEIDRAEWGAFVASSFTGTWFQTPEAYCFYESMPELFKPFVIAVKSEELRAVCVGYVTVEKNAVKQFMMRRAIIVGGPALADNCSEEEVVALMSAVRKQLQSHAIYVETRNFNDYNRWKEAFAKAGFSYEPHLNFHVHTDQGWEAVEENIGKHRKKYIRLSFRDGASVIELPSDGLEENTENTDKKTENIQVTKNDESKVTCSNSNSLAPQSACMQASRQSDDQLLAANALPDDSEKKSDLQSLQKNQKNTASDLKLVRDYYEILKDLYKTKVKMPLQPWSFFEKLYHCPSCKYLLVLYDGQVVGGSICMLLPGHGVYEWYACGKDGVFKNIHPSSVTKYAGMKYACDNGYAVFDMMGAGKPNEEYGVRDFKAEFGGELVEHGRFLCVTKPLLYRIGVLGVTILKKLK